MTRLCYWHPSAIALKPFCNVTYLSDKEAKAMSDFEETRLFENLDLIKKELQQEMQSQAVCELDEVQHNGLVLDVKKVVSDWLASPKKYYFFRFRSAFHFSVKIHQNGFGFCYTQTRDGRPSKIVINRAEFLRK